LAFSFAILLRSSKHDRIIECRFAICIAFARPGGGKVQNFVANLSEEAKEGDLQELFGQFGRLQRVYMAKDLTTGLGKGFAFVTYYNKEDAQKAINKLNGHGYDNLIMQVQVARPKA